MLGVMTLMPSVCFALSAADSTVLQRLWEYRRNYTTPFDGQQQNVYMRYGFDIDKRNALLFLVPTMYVIAKGDRNYVVIRFDRASATAMKGAGWQLEFDSPYKNNCTDKSEFMWNLEGDIVTISYKQGGWKSVTFNIRELTLNSNKLAGYFYVVDDHRYTINYDKSSFSDWSKYTNN